MLFACLQGNEPRKENSIKMLSVQGDQFHIYKLLNIYIYIHIHVIHIHIYMCKYIHIHVYVCLYVCLVVAFDTVVVKNAVCCI